MDDQTLHVGDQDPFAGAIEHGGGLTQALAIDIVLTQPGTNPQTPEQARPGDEDQPGAEQRPEITVDQLPA
ncbi:hypothetical protein D3C73_1479260 [compost metagenome]